MPFITDRDLLLFEPQLARDAAVASCVLARSSATLSGTQLAIAGVDPVASGVQPGHLVYLADLTLEVLAVPSPSSSAPGAPITVSLPRPNHQHPAIAPPGFTGSLPAAILTYSQHIQTAHDRLLAELGLANLDPSDRLHESNIISTNNAVPHQCAAALELIFGVVAGTTGPGSIAAERALFYAKRAAALVATLSVRFAAPGLPGTAGAQLTLFARARRLVRA